MALISTEELITGALARGFDFGGGKPVHLLHYYTQLGLVPKAVRRQVEGIKGHTVGCYPESTLETLMKVQQLRQRGDSISQVKSQLTGNIPPAASVIPVPTAARSALLACFFGAAILLLGTLIVYRGFIAKKPLNVSIPDETISQAIGGLPITLDQNISKGSSSTFASLTLTSATNQIKNSTGKTYTLPDASGILVLTDNSQTLTNKSISGSGNTLTNIPNSALSNSKVTINTSGNLTGGGDVSLGSSLSLVMSSTPTFTSATVSGTFGVGGDASFSAKINLDSLTPNIQATNMRDLVLGGAETGGVFLSPKNTTGLYVNGAGYVGIGTTSPGVTLSVVGSIYANANSTSALKVEQSGVKNNVLLVDTTNGEVGINKAPSEAALDISGAEIDKDVLRLNAPQNLGLTKV